jgi:hypothetical protein
MKRAFSTLLHDSCITLSVFTLKYCIFHCLLFAGLNGWERGCMINSENLLPAITSLAAIICFTIAAFSCRSFAIVSGENHVPFGFFAYMANNGECMAMSTLPLGSFALRFGRVLAVIGTIFGWPLFLLSATKLFVSFSEQSMLQQRTIRLSLTLAATSLLLFIGLRMKECQGSCAPHVVLAAIPAAVFFLVTALAIRALQVSNRVPSPIKLQM